MPSLTARLWVILLLSAFTPFGLIQPGIAQIPEPGTRFLVHQEIVSDGTFELGANKSRFHQDYTVDFAVLALANATPANTWRADYRLDSIRVSNSIDGASPSVFEAWPDKLVLDGTAVYDRKVDGDMPTPILCQLLLENFGATIADTGEVLRFDERKMTRGSFPFLDLSQSIRDTWMRRPPTPVQVGLSWIEDRSIRILSDRIVLPASQTFVAESIPTEATGPVILNLRQTFESSRPRRFPIPVGFGVPPNLKFDAIGPDIETPPPDMRIESVAFSVKGKVAYNFFWGFLESKETEEWIAVSMKVPQPDGLQLDLKNIMMDRRTKMTVRRLPTPSLDEDARGILLGS